MNIPLTDFSPAMLSFTIRARLFMDAHDERRALADMARAKWHWPGVAG